jgi:tRNA(Ile)-lysidine synthase
MGVKLVKPIKHRSVASISASEFQNILWTLKVRKNFAVAVSGGPDSLALLLLSKQYAETNNIKLTAISIDHSLRIDSGAEIQWIKKLTNRHKIRFSYLKWKGKKPESNIMAQAREKRYELLIRQCKKLGLSYLLTAHHLDDEIENFLMRLIRGSGIKGLSSLSPKLKYKNSGITIARPLLNYPKKSLIKYLAINNQEYIEDPTNKNKRFDRTRI